MPALIAAVVVSACVVAMSTFPLFLQPNFGPIDDHTYASWLNRDGNLDVSEAWDLFLGSEVGQFGSAARWRPAYWAIQLSESFIWQDVVWPRYALRALLLVAIASTQAMLLAALCSRVSEALERNTGTLIVGGGLGLRWSTTLSGLGALWFAGMYAWSDVVTRLGPSELFAATGLTIVLVGFYHVLVLRGVGWGLVILGYLLAATSKENFIILIVPILALAIGVYFRNRSLTLQAYASILACISVTIVMMLAVGTTYASSGDVYGSKPSMGQLVLGLTDSPERILLYAACLLVWAGSIWGLWLVAKPRLDFGFVKWGLLIGISVLIILLAETLVYGTSINQPRYLLLTELSLTWIWAAACCLGFLASVTLSAGGRRPLGSGFRGAAIAMAVAMTIASTLFVAATAARSFDNAARAQTLSADLVELRDSSGESPHFVLVAADPGEYETVVSLGRYFAWRMPTSQTSLMYVGQGSSATDEVLRGIEQLGTADGTLIALDPARAASARCVLLGSDASVSGAACGGVAEYTFSCDAIGLRPITNWLRSTNAKICILPSGREVPLSRASG